MRKSVYMLVLVGGILNVPAFAGVTMEMVTVDAGGQEINRMWFYAEGEGVRMDIVPSTDDPEMSTIFRGNDEFVAIDHEKKRYYVFDQKTLDAMSEQMNAAMQEMEKQLASLPPEQRAMAEQMMQGGLQGLMGGEPAPKPRLEAAGSGTWRSSPCSKYFVFEGATKTQEICAAPLKAIEGGDEATKAFRRMTGFFEKMADALPMGGSEDIDLDELLNDIDGFPVVTTQFQSGRVSEVTTLESASNEDIDPARFTIPDGYTRQELMD